ncbi:MAG: HAD family hydrolase [Candidatus Gastranaerophilales bacterium]|nr:HAD family hydrolase [Candidatus Gastranaerophilales bacterium]
MTVVFLDFDGVLFDTLKEAYILCRYAYSGEDIFLPIDNKIYSRFYRYKFLVYNSWQYYYIMKLLSDRGIKTDGDFIAAYNLCMRNRNKSFEEEFDQKYLEKRIELMKKHSHYWNSLEVPFDFFYEIKMLFKEYKIDIIIVTNKNKEAVNKRLSQYGLELETDKIYAKEELLPYKSKAEFINKYMQGNNILRAFFVDDNTNNLTPCREYSGIVPFLAGWGNIGIGESGYSCKDIIQSIIKKE